MLPDYMAHDIIKEFWRNSHFENMTAGFPLRCQNLTRQISRKKYAWKKIFSLIMPFDSYHSHLMWSVLFMNDNLIIFGDHDIHKRQFLLP